MRAVRSLVASRSRCRCVHAHYPAVNGQASSPSRFLGSNAQPPQWSDMRLMYVPPAL